MRYMRGLNEWLAVDVRDRNVAMQGVTGSINRLSDVVNGLGRQAEELGRQGELPGMLSSSFPGVYPD